MVCALFVIACGDVDGALRGHVPEYGSSGGKMDTNSSSSGGGTTPGSGGSAASGGSEFVPEPIPDVDPEPPAPCPEDTPSGYFQFLDDTCGAKTLPSAQDRNRACPVVDLDADVALKDAKNWAAAARACCR